MTKLACEQVKLWCAHDCGNFEIMRATYVTHSFSRHAHDSFCIGIVEQGAVTLPCLGTAHFIPAGNLLVINPGDVHAGHTPVDTGWTYWMIYPDAALLQNAMSEITERRYDLPFFHTKYPR